MKKTIRNISLVFCLFIFLTAPVNEIIPQQRAVLQKSISSSENKSIQEYRSSSNPDAASDVKKEYENYDRWYRKNITRDYRTKDREISSDNIYDRRNAYNDKGFSENYFHIDKNGNSLWDGKHWHQSRFPLKVYVQKSSSPYFKSVYNDFITYAFNIWERADNRIKFERTNSENNADISVRFVEDLMSKYDDDYLGLTNYDLERKKVIDYSLIEISLLKYGNERVNDGELKATIVHEFGHALGLGHSDNQNDIMYPYIDPDSDPEMNYTDLSRGDIEAVQSVIDLGFSEFISKR